MRNLLSGSTQVPQVSEIDRRGPLLHALITGYQQRLHVRELLLSGQCRAQQALAVVARPSVRKALSHHRQDLAQHSFGLPIAPLEDSQVGQFYFGGQSLQLFFSRGVTQNIHRLCEQRLRFAIPALLRIKPPQGLHAMPVVRSRSPNTRRRVSSVLTSNDSASLYLF